MRRMFPRFRFRPSRYRYRYNPYKKLLGLLLGVTGVVIIIMAVPLAFWLFLLGLLLLWLGIAFVKMF